MKFKIIILLLLASCANYSTTSNKYVPYSSKGFAHIFYKLEDKNNLTGPYNNSIQAHNNNELIVNIIDTEIEHYKLVLEASRENIYGESDAKKYYNPVYLNTCYSFSSPERAFSISAWYRLNAKKDRIVSLGSSKTKVNSDSYEFFDETNQAFGWYDTLIKSIYN